MRYQTFKKIIVFQFFFAAVSPAFANTPLVKNTLQLFIAKNGNDKNAGSKAAPFATVERVKEAIRSLKKEGKVSGSVIVNIRAGEYHFDRTLQMDGNDSGAEGYPVIYKAFENEKVSFTGGIRLSATAFKPITDQSVLTRIPKEARDKVVQVNLMSLGVKDYGVLGKNQQVAPELFFNDTAMKLSRWPNDTFATIKAIVDKGDNRANKGCIFTFSDDGCHTWTKTNDAWARGYWGNDWSTNDLNIKDIHFAEKEIETTKTSSYPIKTGQRFYLFNILEELDAPGEYYLDRSCGILYLYPPSPLKDAMVQLSVFDKDLIEMNQTSNVVFSGITMELNRGNAIEMIDGSNNLVENCEIGKMGGFAVSISGGKNNGVVSCHIYNMGNGGIFLSGGDFATLTPAGNYAMNNHIHNYARIRLTYAAAVDLSGVGNRASHNEIHNAPHLAIKFSGNDHIMEYNEIYDVVKETADASAIYSGRSFVWRGNIIRYNYFHNIISSNLRVSTAAIYLDDYLSGIEMYGNIFYKIGKQALKLANGRDNIFANNIIIECGTSIGFMKRTYLPGEKDYNALMEKFTRVPYQNETWSKRYPSLKNIMNDEMLEPKGNIIRNNVMIRSGEMTDEVDKNKQYGTFEGNIILNESEDPGFVDAAKGNFELKDNSVIYSKVPGFTKIPFSKIGIDQGK